MSTRLTVICGVYNGMPYLRDAIESILTQSFKDFVFVIVNDGSTDASAEYLHSLQDPRIVLIEQANQGHGGARNTGLRSCQTEYVAIMDQDDISLPERFAAQVAYLDGHPEVVMLGTQIDLLVGHVTQQSLSIPTGHDAIEALLLKGRAGICHPSIMFRTAATIACGGYPLGVIGEDIDFCLRICEEGRAANLSTVLFQYRLHATQSSLARSREIVSANQFAAYLSVCRRKGLAKPEWSTFLRDASIFRRWKWFVEGWEIVQYRKGRIQLAGSQPLLGMCRLASLGLFRPFQTLRRAAQTIVAMLRRVAPDSVTLSH